MILVACGLLREARIAMRAPHVLAVAGGGDAAALGRRLHAACTANPIRGIVSFGLAGALAPGLCVGDWVVGAAVCGGFDGECDTAWADRLIHPFRHPGPVPGRGFSRAAGAEDTRAPTTSPATRPSAIAVHTGLVHADGTLAATAAAKAALHARTGAIAIDMESHVAARVAAARGLPFAILRVISDSAGDALPPAFARAMRPDGGTNLAAMLRSLATDPGQLPAFLRAAASGRRALAALAAHGPGALEPLPPRS